MSESKTQRQRRARARRALSRRGAAAREAHFSGGGGTGAWRGTAYTFRDRRRDASRNACRGWVDLPDD